MADLYNLLEELEENEAAEHDGEERNKENDPRRETIETMAMTEFGDEEEEELESPQHIGQFVRTSNLDRSDDINEDHRDRDAEAAAFFRDLEDGPTMMMHNPYEETTQREQQDIVPNELYSKLQHHWLQERHCPELLPYDKDMVQAFLQDFEENQEKLDELMTSSHADELLIGNILQQDLDRAKFVLSDWLTQRLNKMEQHPFHILDEKFDHMSEQEKEHLQGYSEAMKKLMFGTVLNNLQEAWQTLDAPNMIEKPDYEGYHFWLVKEEIMDKDGQKHEAGVCLVAKYLDMKEHMTDNNVELLI
ncbi:hypothetical protein IV203_012143 [Nitzschia inconspicua]|uniref:GINS subunit domain-containing protein n=1 Tax=Nitzschia inconspicua TaxID=303405 RepID=A0A9K3KU41_9STRA|nr:hypothetical protein IV203_012143 [Nitzschia inconspicua]